MLHTSLLRLRERQAQGNASLSTLLYETLLYETLRERQAQGIALRVACNSCGVRQAQGRQSQYKCPMPSEYQSFCFFPDCI
ncbi:MAG: hypothetical protein ACYTX0_47610, partial [Nostoc sp.]